MSSKSLTGFIDGYRASNLASTEQQFDFLLPDLVAKVNTLLVESKKSKKVDEEQELVTLLTIIQSGSSAIKRFKEFCLKFIEYVTRLKNKNPEQIANLPEGKLIVAIVRQIISIAETSADDDILSMTLKLGNLLK